MNLSDIFCQSKAIGSLQRAFACGKVAHAYLFAGPDGVGRFATACAWAKLLLCKSPAEAGGFADSCNRCSSCQAFESGSHPDFVHVYKELIRFTKNRQNAAKTPIDLPIDVIKEFLVEKASGRPLLSDSKVYVISESEKLNIPSQNALLKVLEEPPGHCFIILLCTKLENLLDTTQSRCQIIRFSGIDEQKIIEKLVSAGFDEIEARYWARFTEGSLGKSMEFAQLRNEKISFYDIKVSLIDRLSRKKLSDAVDFASWINASVKNLVEIWTKHSPETSKKDLARQVNRAVISMVVFVLSDVMKGQFVAESEFVNFDQPDKIEALCRFFSPEDAALLIEACYESIRWVDAAVNEKLIFEHLLINIASSDKIEIL